MRRKIVHSTLLAAIMLVVLLVSGCSDTADTKGDGKKTAPEVSLSGEVVRVDDLTGDIAALYRDFKSLLPYFEAHLEANPLSGGAGPLDLPDPTVDFGDFEAEIGETYSYSSTEEGLELSIVGPDGLTIGQDTDGLYLIQSMNEEAPSRKDFEKDVETLQSSVTAYVEDHGVVPSLSRTSDGWVLEPGFGNDEGDAPTVKLDLTEDSESKGGFSSSGPDGLTWELVLLDTLSGDLGRVSSEGASYGLRQELLP